MLTAGVALALLTGGGADGPCENLRARRDDVIAGVVALVGAGPSRMARLEALRAQVASLGRCRMSGPSRITLDSLDAAIVRASRFESALEPTCTSRPRSIPLQLALRKPTRDDGTVMGRLRRIAEALEDGVAVTVTSAPGEPRAMTGPIPAPTDGRNRWDDIGTVDSLLSLIEHLAAGEHRGSIVVEDSTCTAPASGAAVEWRALMIEIVSTTVRFELGPDQGGVTVDHQSPGIVVTGLSSGSLQVGGIVPVRTSATGATIYVGAAVNRVEGRSVDRGAIWVGRDFGRWTIVAGADWQSRVGLQAALWPRDRGRLSGGFTVSSAGGVGLVVVARPW